MLLVKRRFELYQESSSLVRRQLLVPEGRSECCWSLAEGCLFLAEQCADRFLHLLLEGLRRKLVFSLARVVSVSFLLNAFSFS